VQNERKRRKTKQERMAQEGRRTHTYVFLLASRGSDRGGATRISYCFQNSIREHDRSIAVAESESAKTVKKPGIVRV
jgi:hypothetical protein